jgi:hypothetical protein
MILFFIMMIQQLSCQRIERERQYRVMAKRGNAGKTLQINENKFCNAWDGNRCILVLCL